MFPWWKKVMPSLYLSDTHERCSSYLENSTLLMINNGKIMYINMCRCEKLSSEVCVGASIYTRHKQYDKKCTHNSFLFCQININNKNPYWLVKSVLRECIKVLLSLTTKNTLESQFTFHRKTPSSIKDPEKNLIHWMPRKTLTDSHNYTAPIECSVTQKLKSKTV